MKRVTVPQNGREWLAWRGKGLGASDAPAVMGVSPWTTPFELWTYKTGLCTPPEPHPAAVAAMRRGQELEPLARALAEKALGQPMPSVSGEHDVYPFIRASLDGLSADGKLLLEIKCPGKEDHAKAVKGKVPDKYYPQLQQQFLVSGAEVGVYYSWDGKSAEGVAIEVLPDGQYIEALERSLIAFWRRVELGMAPNATRTDLEKLTERLSADVKRLNNTISAMSVLAGALEDL